MGYGGYVRSGPPRSTSLPSTGVALTTAKWGPLFGAAGPLAGNRVGVAALVARSTGVRAGNRTALPAVKGSATVRTGSRPLVWSVKGVAAVRAGNRATLPTVKGAATVLAGNRTAMGTPKGSATVRAGNRATLPAAKGAATVRAGNDITALKIITGTMLAAKDVYTPTVALCPDDANKNAEDLIISSAVAATRDSYWSFDLSAFPAAATVTAATLTVNRVSGGGGTLVNLFKLADADEGWSETTMVCSNRKAADGAAVQQVSITNSNGEHAFVLNADWITRLDARMGQSSVSFLAQMVTTTITITLNSSDEGTNNSLGPRLTLTFTTAT